MPRIFRAVITVAFLALCFSFSGAAYSQDGRSCIPFVEHMAQAKAHPNFAGSALIDDADFKKYIAYAQGINGATDKWDGGYFVLRSDGVVIFFLMRGTDVCGAYMVGPEAFDNMMQAVRGDGA